MSRSLARGATNLTFDGDATGFVFNATVTFFDANGGTLDVDTMDVTVGGDPVPGDDQASIDAFGGKVKNIRIRERNSGSGYRVVVSGDGTDIADAVTAEVQFNEPFEGPVPQENPVTVSLKPTLKFKAPNLGFTGDPAGHSWTARVTENLAGGGLAATSDPIPLSYAPTPPADSAAPHRVKGDLRENAEYRVIVIVKDDTNNEVNDVEVVFDENQSLPAPSVSTLPLSKKSRKAIGSAPITFASDPAGSLYTVTATLLDNNGKPIGQPGMFDLELGRDKLGALRTTMLAPPPSDDTTSGLALTRVRIQEKTNGDRVIHANLVVNDVLEAGDDSDTWLVAGTDGFDVSAVADVQLTIDAIVGPLPTSNQLAIYNWETRDRWVSAPIAFDEDPSGQSYPIDVIFQNIDCENLACCPIFEDCGVHDEEEMLME